MPKIKAQIGDRQPRNRRGGEERGARGGGDAAVNVGQGVGADAGNDVVPVILPPAVRKGHAALEGPEHGQETREPAGEARHVRADGADAAGEASAIGRVEEPLGEVVGGSDRRADHDAVAHVVDEAVAVVRDLTVYRQRWVYRLANGGGVSLRGTVEGTESGGYPFRGFQTSRLSTVNRRILS